MTLPRFPSSRHHADPFYDYNDEFAPGSYLPLIDPYFAVQRFPHEASTQEEIASSPWILGIDTIWIDIPNSNAEYPYGSVYELEKFAINNNIIIAYSSYIDPQADSYVQNDYYHWFVVITDKNITKGFHTENEFNQYIQTLGIQNLDWQIPSVVFAKYYDTGCLDWIPDCN